jgi:hypothetical protein
MQFLNWCSLTVHLIGLTEWLLGYLMKLLPIHDIQRYVERWILNDELEWAWKALRLEGLRKTRKDLSEENISGTRIEPGTSAKEQGMLISRRQLSMPIHLLIDQIIKNNIWRIYLQSTGYKLRKRIVTKLKMISKLMFLQTVYYLEINANNNLHSKYDSLPSSARPIAIGSRDSSVGIATGYGLDHRD